MKEVSVIIPYFNGDIELFNKCLDSVYENTSLETEIVVINDGSDEEHSVMLRTAVEGREGLKLIEQENKGVSAARNRGIKESEGRYITFVDADDMILNHFIDEAHRIAEAGAYDMVKGKLIRGRELPEKTVSTGNLKRIKDKGDLISHMISFKNLYHFKDGSYISRGPVAFLVRREYAEEVCFDENIKIGEDCIWNIDAIGLMKRIVLVNSLWYFYYENDASACNKVNPDALDEYLKKQNALKERVDLSSAKLYKSFAVNFVEDMKAVHRVYLYKGLKACDKKQLKAERKRAYEEFGFEELFKSKNRWKLDFFTRFQIFLFEGKRLFNLYDLFRNLRALRGKLK